MFSDADLDGLVMALGQLVHIDGRPQYVIWGELGLEVPSGDTAIGSQDFLATVTAEVADGIPMGATVVRQGVAYRVADHRPDEDGDMIQLVLERLA